MARAHVHLLAVEEPSVAVPPSHFFGGNIWSAITYCTKEQNLGSTAGATAVLRYPAILLPGALVPPGLLVSPSGFRAPCVLRVLSVVLLRT